MTTEIFLDSDPAGSLERLCVSVSGKHNGARAITKTIVVKAAVDFSTPGEFDVLAHTDVKAAKKNHVLGIWKELMFSFVPLTGIVGRGVTLYVAWAPPGHDAPKTQEDFFELPGSQVKVFGGKSDPDYKADWEAAPFSGSRHKVIFSNSLKVEADLKLYYAVESEEIAKEGLGVGPLFLLRVTALVDVYGSYY